MIRNEILSRLDGLSGEIGFYCKNLYTGESLGLREDDLFRAASVIKLPLYAAVQKLCAEGAASMAEELICRQKDKVPPCGALCFFTGEVKVDIRTLCGLMISLSDNTAANLLLDRFGMEELNRQFRELGLKKTRLERRFMDRGAAARGRENWVTPREMGGLLERIYRRELIGPGVSREMEALLLQQQIRHKIPGRLPACIPVAHKTGEDEGITHDVGIVFAGEPFLLCFMSNNTDVPRTERAIRRIALALAEKE